MKHFAWPIVGPPSIAFSAEGFGGGSPSRWPNFGTSLVAKPICRTGVVIGKPGCVEADLPGI